MFKSHQYNEKQEKGPGAYENANRAGRSAMNSLLDMQEQHRDAVHSNHHDEWWALVLVHMDLIVLHCKVLSIYRSRNNFTTEMQSAAFPTATAALQEPSPVHKDIPAHGRQHSLFQTQEPMGSGVCA